MRTLILPVLLALLLVTVTSDTPTATTTTAQTETAFLDFFWFYGSGMGGRCLNPRDRDIHDLGGGRHWYSALFDRSEAA